MAAVVLLVRRLTCSPHWSWHSSWSAPPSGGARRAVSRGGPHVSDGSSVRRFFTYLLLFGLLMVAGQGVDGLLSGAMDGAEPYDVLEGLRAQQTAFAVVGVPLYAALAVWTRTRIRQDPAEGTSRGFTFYLTAASVVSLILTVTALQTTAGWLLVPEFSGTSDFSGVLVWGASWLGHQWVERGLAGRHVLTRAGFLGATIGLLVTASGAVMVVADLLGRALRISTTWGLDGPTMLQTGAATLIAGLPVWVVSWLLPMRHLQRGRLWHVHVLLVGVAGGLLGAVTGASVALDRLVVWLVHGAGTGSGKGLSDGLALGLGALVVGALVWAYHRAVLRVRDGERTEVRRAYDYLLAGVGLVAASVGLVVMVVAGLEGVSSVPVPLLGDESPVDTVIAAATLLGVGAPTWWLFWHRCERAVRSDPVEERRSLSRRVYVFVLFGAAAVVAVVALLIGVGSVVQDSYADALGAQTLHTVRYPIGIILTAGLLAGYHWTVHREDRKVVGTRQHGPRSVVLVGPADPEVARAVRRHTGGSVTLMARTDVAAAPWRVEELDAVLDDLPDAAVVVVADERGALHPIPVTPA